MSAERASFWSTRRVVVTSGASSWILYRLLHQEKSGSAWTWRPYLALARLGETCPRAEPFVKLPYLATARGRDPRSPHARARHADRRGPGDAGV